MTRSFLISYSKPAAYSFTLCGFRPGSTGVAPEPRSTAPTVRSPLIPGTRTACEGAPYLLTLKFLSVWLPPPPARTLTSRGIGVSIKVAKFANTLPLPVPVKSQVTPKVIELDIRCLTRTVRLLVVPARADIHLPVRTELPIVLHIERFRVGVCIGIEFIVTNARRRP